MFGIISKRYFVVAEKSDFQASTVFKSVKQFDFAREILQQQAFQDIERGYK
jgi:hypothetical protein